MEYTWFAVRVINSINNVPNLVSILPVRKERPSYPQMSSERPCQSPWHRHWQTIQVQDTTLHSWTLVDLKYDSILIEIYFFYYLLLLFIYLF